MRIGILLLLLMGVSCSTINNSRKDFTKSELSLRGGVSASREWSDDLTFKRYSWYKETVLNYDILLAEINKDSPFIDWMESDLPKMEGCHKFYIGLFYTRALATYSSVNLISKIEAQGYEDFILPDFRDNFQAHPNAMDWEIVNHKLVGLCQKNSSTGSIKIKIPGFKMHKLK